MDTPKQPVLGGIDADPDADRADPSDGRVAGPEGAGDARPAGVPPRVAEPEPASDARPTAAVHGRVAGSEGAGDTRSDEVPRVTGPVLDRPRPEQVEIPEQAGGAGSAPEGPSATPPGSPSARGRLVVPPRPDRSAGAQEVSTGPTAVSSGAAPTQGRLVTNHLNLLYMLAAGLVLPRSGFGGKYYQDTLDACPGWIPLFTGLPSRAAVDHATAEAGHLKPCQVVVSLTACAGPVMVPTPGGIEERRWPDGAGDAPLVFVPAPLPLSAVESIVFGSHEDLEACRDRARDVGNVPLDEFEVRALKRFSAARGPGWPPPQGPSARETRLGAAQATGGMLAMLLKLAHEDRGRILAGDDSLGLAACRAAFEPADDPPELGATAAAGLAKWVHTGRSPAPPPTQPAPDPGGAARLFWGAVDTLAEQAGVAGVDEANARLLDYLDRESPSLDERLGKHVVELRETLESLTGLADLTASDLFDRFSTPFPRAMCLLFLRRTCAELLEFDHEKLSPEDRLAAALLFGARAGWLVLPLSLRRGPAASAAVSHRMAALSHRLADTGFGLGPAPSRPKALAELFAGDWSARQQDAAVALARKQTWTDCLQTRVRLGPGQYVLKVGRGGTEIVFPGEARAVKTEVDRARFARLLATASIDPEHEAAVMGMLADGAATAPRGRRRRDRRRGGDRRAGE